MHSKVTINKPWTTQTTLCMTRTMQHKDQPLLWCVSGVKGYLVMMNFGLITPLKKLKNLLCYDLNNTKNLYTYFEKTHCLVLCFLGELLLLFFWMGGVVIFIICLLILTICLVLMNILRIFTSTWLFFTEHQPNIHSNTHESYFYDKRS